MKNIIAITTQNVGGQNINSVDARELHAFLGSKKKFADWVINKVVGNAFFEENQDFILLPQSVKQNGSGGHNRKDYALTVDTAKKVAMAEQTERGNEAREYFLEMERKAQAVQNALPDFSDPVEAARAWANEMEAKQRAEKEAMALEHKNLHLEAKAAEMAPKVDFHDAVTQSDSEISFNSAAKILAMKEVFGRKRNVGEKILFDYCRYHKILTQTNKPYQKHVNAGHFRVVEMAFRDGKDRPRVGQKTVVLQRGLDYLRKHMLKNGHVQTVQGKQGTIPGM